MKKIIEHIESAFSSDKSAADHEASRLFHGRGHCYPDLDYINVDWFSPVLLITLYQEPPAEQWQDFIASLKALQLPVECCVVQHRYLRDGPVETLWGELPEQLVATELGLRFKLSIGSKQNIGFFMDMAPGRAWLHANSQGKRVLNLFAYTCPFSVMAVDGGADYVLNVDMSKAALSVGRDNHRLNDQVTKGRIEFFPYELFRSWKRVIGRGPFDIVVLDPPSRQKGSFIADKDYVRALRKLPSLMPNGGEVLACLNAPELGDDFIHNAFEQVLPQATFIERLANREDFPESDPRRNVKMLRYAVPAGCDSK